MILQIHCYIERTKIDPLPKNFTFEDFLVEINNTNVAGINGLELRAKKSIDSDEFISHEDDREQFTRKILSKYRAELQRMTLYLEGLLSVYFPQNPIDFDISHVMVNVSPETDSEKMLFEDKNNKVIWGAGDVHVNNPPGYIYPWSDVLQQKLEDSSDYLPSLSFFSQALKAESRHEQEVAFFLLFRIIEGYYGDGTPKIEEALKARSVEIEKYLPTNPLIQASLKNILIGKLRLPSKSQSGNINDLISDLVLLRHKMVHFNQATKDRYFNVAIKPDLAVINRALIFACIKVIRKELMNE